MQKNLIIVESPAKAKTIERFLGKDYKVMSSYGHIRDLKKKQFSIDVEDNFKPEYEIPADKKTLVSELKKAVKDAEMVWLASDEDREGEAIAWHLFEVLGLEEAKTKRIVFHEITKTAIVHAIENPRDIDVNLVNAQQARRILDRIVGFELSPILWRKIKPALSAGRVQSVAVRLIVEKEREIQNFQSSSAYRILAHFELSDGTTILEAEYNKRLKTKEEVLELLESCKNEEFKIGDISTKPVTKSPAAPFTTSTLQQEASRKLGYSVSQTMMLAQRLYEAGAITYMRTDSVNLSNLALNTAKQEIIKQYGEKYHQARNYQTKSKGAQEAHEAIRPTYIDREEQGANQQERKLYDLIRKRTIASQMANAELERTTITIPMSSGGYFSAVGEVVKFDGFFHVYTESYDEDRAEEDNTKLLPKVNIGEVLSMEDVQAIERFTQRPARYTEASLVRRLEELGIGRPSTYAPTIQTILNREYVEKGNRPGEKRSYEVLQLKQGKISEKKKTEVFGADKNKLLPTDIGCVVNDFLMEYFPSIMDYSFTAKVEKDFDTVADGEVEWTEVLDHFYKMFHPVVEETMSIKQERKVGERLLGEDPKTGKPVFVKIGRYGSMVQLGEAQEGDEKPQFASLPPNRSMDLITLDEALELFKLPRDLGVYEDSNITVAIGRFGPYVKHNNKFASIPKELDPFTLTKEEAIELIKEKRKAEANKIIKTFDEDPEVQILKGRYGPYIGYKKKNYRIPKTQNPEELTLAACMEIINEAPKKTAKKATRKTTKKKN